MALTPWNVDWLNSNSQRNYPLADDATCRDDTDSFELPQDFIVDLVITVPSAVVLVTSPDQFHVKSLASFTGGAVITFGYAGTTVGSVAVSESAHVKNSSYRFVGQGENFYDISGVVTIGSFDNLSSLPGGLYSFTTDTGRLASTVIRPALRGVSSIFVTSGTVQSERLSGDIQFIAGRNFQITSNTALNQIRFDCLAEDQDLRDTCNCADPTLDLPCIRTVNDVGPDVNGNIEILGNTCLTIVSGDNKLILDDICSAPCCGCEELNTLRSDIRILYSQVAALMQNANRIENGLQLLTANIRPDFGCPPPPVPGS